MAHNLNAETSGHGGKALFAWVGGKSALAQKIIPLIPPHHCYCEVFAGAAWILFKKTESRVEIINDVNLELATLYRVVKYHLDEFIRYLRWMLASRDEFARFKATDPATLTDVQRAVRFYYLQKSAFAGGLHNLVFRSESTHRPRFNLLRIEEELSEAHLRLQGVLVENLPYEAVLERFDNPDTFFYLDPPYFGRESYYGRGIFSREDFAKLAELLDSIKGRFILSINDVKPIRQLFGRFHIRPVSAKYRVGQANHKPVRELLIMNFKPPRATI